MAPSLTESPCASEGFMDKCPNFEGNSWLAKIINRFFKVRKQE